jgi:hypothetical protein
MCCPVLCAADDDDEPASGTVSKQLKAKGKSDRKNELKKKAGQEKQEKEAGKVRPNKAMEVRGYAWRGLGLGLS